MLYVSKISLQCILLSKNFLHYVGDKNNNIRKITKNKSRIFNDDYGLNHLQNPFLMVLLTKVLT